MYGSIVLAFAASLVSGQGTMSFDCSDSLQDVCSHMCWGAYCTSPAIGATLNYDAPSDATERKRRTSSGCLPSPNRCSVNSGYKKGYNCDEYPFASTSEADDGGQTIQCVVSGHNSHQGGIIAAYTRSECGGEPCEFTIGFGNADGVQYCDASSSDQSSCQNNGEIYTKNGEASDPSARKVRRAEPLGVRFLTESGMTLILPPHYEVGHVTKKATPSNATMKALSDITNEDADLVQWTFVDDKIVERLD